jgi:23S rRNA (uracil1939-C5)-methyltransferase
MMRRSVHELAAWNHCGRLGQPRGEPVRGDLTLGLIARSGASVEPVIRGRAEKKGLFHYLSILPFDTRLEKHPNEGPENRQRHGAICYASGSGNGSAPALQMTKSEGIKEVLKIEKLVYGGEGLSRPGGEVVLTPFVLAGETVEAERLTTRKQVQRAKLLRVTEASADRTAPPCPVFGQCGGCQYQHASYSAQLRFKREILAETLRRVGKIEYDTERIAIESGPPYSYRNRVQLHIEHGRVGYRAMNSHRLVPVEECPVGAPKLNEVIATLNRMTRDRRWPGFVSSLEVFTDDVQVQWNVLETEKNVGKHFFEWLAEEVPGSVGGPLDYFVNEDSFRVSGSSFFQINRFLLPRLAQLAIGDYKGGSAWDLYAGVGLFSLPLARSFDRVTAVESGRSAASDLKWNAEGAGVNVEIALENAEAWLASAAETPDLVLADPPRAGLGKSAVARLLELRPADLVLVACDPATLARDLAALSAAYSIERLTLVDLFPQTFHLETIAHLKLR